MLAYGLAAGTLALRRHWNLASQALDMGYADQITWNMTQGRLYRFTPFRGAAGSELGRPLEYGPGADRDSLFAYHVELLYLSLSLLYFIHPGPETLIVFLTATLAFGAVPTYLIAQRPLKQRAGATRRFHCPGSPQYTGSATSSPASCMSVNSFTYHAGSRKVIVS